MSGWARVCVRMGGRRVEIRIAILSRYILLCTYIYDVIHTLRKSGFVIRARLEQCTYIYNIIILCIISVHVDASVELRAWELSITYGHARAKTNPETRVPTRMTHKIYVYKYMRTFNNV